MAYYLFCIFFFFHCMKAVCFWISEVFSDAFLVVSIIDWIVRVCVSGLLFELQWFVMVCDCFHYCNGFHDKHVMVSIRGLRFPNGTPISDRIQNVHIFFLSAEAVQ